MKLIDMHCDTLMKLLEQPEQSLSGLDAEVNLPELRQAGSMAQFFACFTNLMDYPQPPERAYDEAYRTALRMIGRMKEEIEKAPQELALATSAQEILDNAAAGKISAFLTVEEGGILNGRMERLHELYDRGVRLITLTWNYENCLGYPNSADAQRMAKGLKSFGVEVVEEMNRLGMVVDVSHLSDGGFWEVARHSKKPFVATHSCVRELCGHPRNLSREMLRAVGEKGGAVGVNFYGGFLSEDGVSTTQRIAQHLRFIADTAGMEAAAIGTDFDGGISANPLEIDRIGRMELLYPALQKEGFSDGEIEQIFWKNVLRVIRETVG